MEQRLVISFSDSEDILPGLTDALKQHDVDFARFSSAEGSIKDFELISDNYEDVSKISDVYIVDKISGRALKQNGRHNINLHFTLIRKDAGKTLPFSGELKKGLVAGDLTIVLTLTDMKKIIY